MEEEKIVEEQKSETQGEQIVELTPFQAFKQKIEEGSKTVDEILYSDGVYFSL